MKFGFIAVLLIGMLVIPYAVYGIQADPTSDSNVIQDNNVQIQPIVATQGFDYAKYGFTTVLEQRNITPGVSMNVPGEIQVFIPNDTFSTPVKFQVLVADPTSFNLPSNELPVKAFAFRVTDLSTGQQIQSFQEPVMVTIFNRNIERNSIYYNVNPDGNLTVNPTGMQIMYNGLQHPVKTTSVAWVISTPVPKLTGDYTVDFGVNSHVALVNRNGNILTDSKGRTLYTYDKDAPGKSYCTGNCTNTWIPYTIPMGQTPTSSPALTGKVGVITRSNGAYQVTYNYMPLYYYVGDSHIGEANGQGFANLWYVVPLHTPYESV